MNVGAATDSTGSPPDFHHIRPHVALLAFSITVVAVYFHSRALLSGLGGGIQLALAILAVLVALEPLLARFARLTRPDIIVIYCFVLVASNGYDLTARFMPAYTVPRYFSTPDNNYAKLADETIPSWFAPSDPEVIRVYYEGSEDGRTDYRPWLKPLGLWLLFFMALWGTLYCLTALLRRHWVEHEHLAFPMVTVPLYIAAAGAGRLRPRRTVWHEPLMWIGFGLSCLHFLGIMLHATNPGVPTLGTHYDLGKLFTEQPLNALRPLFLFIHNPALSGLAYFAPQDLTFSIWFFFVFYFKPIALFYRVAGMTEPSGFPFYWEQSAGAFVAIALFYAWAARGYLWKVWQAAVGGGWLPGESEERRWAEPMSYRLALAGLVCGFVAVCAWYMAAGMSWWVAGLFFFLVVIFAVIYTRGRAESGVAYLASFPFWQASRQIKSWLGSAPLLAGGKYTNLAMLGSLIFLHFGEFPQGMTYQVETLKLGEQTRLKTSQLTWLVMGAMLVGIVMYQQAFLSMSHQWGNNALAGGTTAGGYGVSIARAEWEQVSSIANGVALKPDWNRNAFTLAAFLFTLVLVAIRSRFPHSPFHPLGFVMTTSYGYAYWGPFFSVWLVKVIILRLGGARLYHRLTPVFVGLVLGQIVALGLVWQIWAAFSSDEWKTLADPLIYF